MFCWCSSRPYSRLFILDYCWHLHSKTCSHFLGKKKSIFLIIHPELFIKFNFDLFQGALSLVYLCTSDIYVLINYASFVESSFILLSIASLLYLRWKQPDLPRPIRVSLPQCKNYRIFLSQILREIKVGKCWVSKSAILTHWEVLDFYLLRFFALLKAKSY